MKQNNAEELYSAKGRLIAKYYMDKGVIEIRQTNEYFIIIVQMGTDIELFTGEMSLTM